MIRIAVLKDEMRISSLHILTLQTGFLSALGRKLLSMIYRHLIMHEKVWVYVENEKIQGFISLSVNGEGVMKRFILNNPFFLFRFFFYAITKPSVFFKAFETFRAPTKTVTNTIPNLETLRHLPELLSVAVNSELQTSGIGSLLLIALEEYLLGEGYVAYKVVAGAELVGANRFYQKNGFRFAYQISIHGSARSNVYVKQLINSFSS